jgi:hypothetical protein
LRFVLTGPEDSGSDLEPEGLLDVLLIDLPEMSTLDWDCRENSEGSRPVVATCSPRVGFDWLRCVRPACD